jgi:RNA polymerase sigma-70 factor (ECF subfamily)
MGGGGGVGTGLARGGTGVESEWDQSGIRVGSEWDQSGIRVASRKSLISGWGQVRGTGSGDRFASLSPEPVPQILPPAAPRRNAFRATRVRRPTQHDRESSRPLTRFTVDELQLIARARTGDAAAERALYDAHVERVYRLAYRMSGRDDLAQDFTQDAFIRAFARLGDFRGDAAFGTWLHTIAVSVVLNGLRKSKRFEEREATLDETIAVAARTPVAEPDLRQRMAAAIDALPDGYRTVFVMHDVEGYKHEEIGAALGIASGTSKAQLFRARQKLREALADFAGEYVQ